MVRLLVAYDIRDDRRRAKVARTLEGYGLRVQLSVFSCCVRPMQLERLRADLARHIDGNEDSVALVLLCERCAQNVKWLGQCGEVEAFEQGDIVV